MKPIPVLMRSNSVLMRSVSVLMVLLGVFQTGFASADLKVEETVLSIDAHEKNGPVRIGIDGLSHDHVHWILSNYQNRNDIQIVGIAEPNRNRAQQLADSYGFDMDIVFDDLETMVETTQPEGVVAFNSIYDHLNTVEVCAPRGIHVMVEKPLAVSFEHAERMASLARENNIHLLTNYETTWYPNLYKAFDMVVKDGEIGEINKVLINDGHKGPVEIGCSPEFLEWLTDPVLNGGGAVTDFGCYGANIMTWIMQNELPETVTAVLQTIKPEVYPEVDDQATIILTYPNTQAVIQASWNWPIDRKDLTIYGSEGYVETPNQHDLEFRLSRSEPKQEIKVTDFPNEYDEPFNYFAGVIKGDIIVSETDLSSLENNMIVVRILDAAKESSEKGETIFLNSETGLGDNSEFGKVDNSQHVCLDEDFASNIVPDSGSVTGGDGTYSVALPDGRSIFLMGDSYIGPVKNGSRSNSDHMFRNTYIVYDDGEVSAIYGANGRKSSAAVPPGVTNEHEKWYWPGHGFVKDDKLYIFQTLMYQGAEGMWGFMYETTDILEYSLHNLELISTTRIPFEGSEDIHFGMAALEDGDYIYIYAQVDIDNSFEPISEALVARTTIDKLYTEWEYFDGSGWSLNSEDAVKMEGLADVAVSSQFNVFKLEDKYVLFTQHKQFNSGEIYSFIADSPEGPWYNKQLLYEIPEHSNPNVFTYNAMVHPQFEKEGKILINYNINNLDFSDQLKDVSTYRPVFLWVKKEQILGKR